MTETRTLVRGSVLAVLAGILVGLLSTTSERGTKVPPDESYIQDSYAFDVKDKRQLMGYASEVFVAQVVEKVETDQQAGMTLWRVSVLDSIKGSRIGEALVRQLGYVDDNGKEHHAEEQPLLAAGKRYLLVTTRQSGAGENTLVAGPSSSVEVGPAEHQRSVASEYRAAMR